MEPAEASPRPILSVIDSLAVGGAQRHVSALCAELLGTPHATDIFVLTRAGDFFSSRIEARGGRVAFGAAHRAAAPLIAWRLRGAIRAGGYRIVHSYLPASYLLSALAVRGSGARHVTTICAREAQISSPILSFRNYARLQRRTDLYLTPFPSQAEAIGVAREKLRFTLFANDYELDRRIPRGAPNPVVERHGLEGAGPVLLAVGRLHPDKGHEHAIGALARLRREHPGARLLILGEGTDEARLRGLASPESGVVFCGTARELAPYYSIADLYLNTAVNEGLNLSQLQAMAYGIPTLAFDTGFMEYEQAGKEQAMARVPVGDSEGLAAAMRGLLADRSRYEAIRQAGFAFSAQYGNDRVVRAYTSCYDELLGAGSGGASS
jgi:glycosyltransferase involved in cell wall biosynthesis